VFHSQPQESGMVVLQEVSDASWSETTFQVTKITR
jgi:hypothetical protein